MKATGKYESECCSKPAVNVKLLINEHYGWCVVCGKYGRVFDTGLSQPLTHAELIDGFKNKKDVHPDTNHKQL